MSVAAPVAANACTVSPAQSSAAQSSLSQTASSPTAAPPSFTALQKHSTEDRTRTTAGGAVVVSRAEQLHAVLHRSICASHVARIEGLRAIAEIDRDRLYLSLGFSSVVGYLNSVFKVPRSTAFEYRTLARRLDEVPRIVAAFERGCFPYAVLRQLIRIADSETEDAWLELATDLGRSAEAVIAEVRDAQRSGRRRPRKETRGLPNLVSRLVLELTREQLEIVHTALGLFATECGLSRASMPAELGDVDASTVETAASAGGENEQAIGPAAEAPEAPVRFTVEEGLVALSQWIVDRGGVTSVGRSDGDSSFGAARPSATRIIYHHCPRCRAATVETADGLVEVDEDSVVRRADSAEVVTISPEEERELEALPDGEKDRPNSSTLAARVKSRDGDRCQNPTCKRRGGVLHAHHLLLRSFGGRTSLANEITVCDTCHALVHAGLLRIEGTIASGLEWRPKLLLEGRGVEGWSAGHRRVRVRRADSVAVISPNEAHPTVASPTVTSPQGTAERVRPADSPFEDLRTRARRREELELAVAAIQFVVADEERSRFLAERALEELSAGVATGEPPVWEAGSIASLALRRRRRWLAERSVAAEIL